MGSVYIRLHSSTWVLNQILNFNLIDLRFGAACPS